MGFYAFADITNWSNNNCEVIPFAKRQSNFLVSLVHQQVGSLKAILFRSCLHRFSKSWMIWTVSFNWGYPAEYIESIFLSSCNFFILFIVLFIEKEFISFWQLVDSAVHPYFSLDQVVLHSSIVLAFVVSAVLNLC
jgi:hypothetical protein